jgi:hypothetical protein
MQIPLVLETRIHRRYVLPTHASLSRVDVIQNNLTKSSSTKIHKGSPE